MASPFEDEAAVYRVAVNDEGQYSLWPAFLPMPDGWAAVGPEGDRRSCVAWIDTAWSDMRPNSLLARMKSSERSPDIPEPSASNG